MTSYYLMKGTRVKVMKNGSWQYHILREEIDTAGIENKTTEVIGPMNVVVVGSYKGFKIEYRPNQTATRRTKLKGDGSCKKCGGCGYIPGFQHIQGGKCFSCGPVGN